MIKEIIEYLKRDKGEYEQFVGSIVEYRRYKDKSHLKSFYDHEHYQRIYKGKPNPCLGCKFKVMMQLMNLKSGERVLDVGCASQMLRPYVTKYGARYTGLDVSEKFHPDIIADAENMHVIEDDTYDWVVLADVLEHLPNPRNAIREATRVGKKIIAVVPNLYHLNSLTFLPSNPKDDHLIKMRPKEWMKMFENTGVKILRTRGFMFTPSVTVYELKPLEAIDLIFVMKPFLFINDVLDRFSEGSVWKYLGQEFIILGERKSGNVLT